MPLPNFTFRVDANNALRTNAYRTKSVQFGDGYKQLAPAGINNKVDTWSLTLPMLTELDVSLVEAFFDPLGQHGNFNWTPPRGVVGIYRLTEPIKYQANGLDRLGKTRTTVTLSIEKVYINTRYLEQPNITVATNAQLGWIISRTGSTSGSILIGYTLAVTPFGGTATITTGTLTISSGFASGTVNVTAATAKRTEVLTLTSSTSYTLSSVNSATINIDADPLFANVVLLLPLTLSSGLTDVKSAKVVTNQGSAISNLILDPFGNNYGVRQFNGNNQRIVVAQSADFAFGASAFAIDFWIYPNSSTLWSFLDTRPVPGPTNWFVMQSINQALFYDINTTNLVATPSLLIGQWNYVCISRDTTNPHKIWINGVLGASVSGRNDSITANSSLLIGDRIDAVPGSSFNGYLSNFRITRAYRDGGTIPTAPFPTS